MVTTIGLLLVCLFARAQLFDTDSDEFNDCRAADGLQRYTTISFFSAVKHSINLHGKQSDPIPRKINWILIRGNDSDVSPRECRMQGQDVLSCGGLELDVADAGAIDTIWAIR